MNEHFLAIRHQYKDSKFFHFGMINVSYSIDQLNPEISIHIKHYASDELIEINFKEIYFHGVMDEGFIYMHDEDEWEVDIFIAKAKNSQLIKWLSSYTLLGATPQIELEMLHHYRVYTQNQFVEIITTQKPEYSIRK